MIKKLINLFKPRVMSEVIHYVFKDISIEIQVLQKFQDNKIILYSDNALKDYYISIYPRLRSSFADGRHDKWVARCQWEFGLKEPKEEFSVEYVIYLDRVDQPYMHYGSELSLEKAIERGRELFIEHAINEIFKNQRIKYTKEVK